jgi:hypothetical protein
MRNAPATPFWKNALASLPAPVRERYALQFEAAERWELWLDAAVEAWTGAKTAVSRTLKHRAPRMKNA